MKLEVLFLCDRKRCKECEKKKDKYCFYTTDIEHSLNFKNKSFLDVARVLSTNFTYIGKDILVETGGEQ